MNFSSTRDSIIISLFDAGTSIFGGFAIYSTIGFMAHKLGLPVDKVIQPGPGLAFIVYAEGLKIAIVLLILVMLYVVCMFNIMFIIFYSCENFRLLFLTYMYYDLHFENLSLETITTDVHLNTVNNFKIWNEKPTWNERCLLSNPPLKTLEN